MQADDDSVVILGWFEGTKRQRQPFTRQKPVDGRPGGNYIVATSADASDNEASSEVESSALVSNTLRIP